MGRDSIRYFLYLNGRWRWRPTKAMRAHGFGLVTMGRGGPGKDADGNPAASLEDQERAIGLNRAWDQVRSGQLLTPARTTLVNWPEGSVGHGYQRAMELRKADRLAKGVVWTSRQEKRDSWPRAWKWLIRFGDCDPRTIMPEHFLRIDPVTGKATGLVAEIESAVSRTERHMTIKVWRALWKRMQAMHGYCDGFADPSLAFANSAPDPRQEIWLRREVLKLVQVAWRNGFCGLAACMAVAWDSMLSPIDARSLTQGQASRDGVGLLFTVARAKTGGNALAMVAGDLDRLSRPDRRGDARLHAVVLDSRGTASQPQRPDRAMGRRSWWWSAYHPPALYRAPVTAGFRDGTGAGLRPTRTAPACRHASIWRGRGRCWWRLGHGPEQQDGEYGLGLEQATTYNPTNVPSVRRFDEARVVGAQKLERKTHESVTTAPLVTLLTQRRKGKSLK